VCRGGRPRERGIEAQKAPYTGPDRLGPGFEPPLTGVSWVGLAALGVHSTSGTTPLRARARVLGFGGVRTKPPRSGIPLGFFGTTRLTGYEPGRTKETK
jgi:hypothetical protein